MVRTPSLESFHVRPSPQVPSVGSFLSVVTAAVVCCSVVVTAEAVTVVVIVVLGLVVSAVVVTAGSPSNASNL